MLLTLISALGNSETTFYQRIKACACTVPAAAVALRLLDPARGRLIVAGDPLQLPPTVLSPDAQHDSLATSLFEHLQQSCRRSAPEGAAAAKGSAAAEGAAAEGAMRGPGPGASASAEVVVAKPLFPAATLLDTQYRMHASIAAFPSLAFYGGRLRTAARAAPAPAPAPAEEQEQEDGLFQSQRTRLSRLVRWPNPRAPVCFLEVPGSVEASLTATNSKSNLPESKLATRLLEGLEMAVQREEEEAAAEAEEETTKETTRLAMGWAATTSNTTTATATTTTTTTTTRSSSSSSGSMGSKKCRSAPLSVAVITPYDGQRKLLQRKMHSRQRRLRMAADGGGGIKVAVATVDAFQGQAADLVVLSTVRANDRGAVGFLGDWRRLNVVSAQRNGMNRKHSTNE